VNMTEGSALSPWRKGVPNPVPQALIHNGFRVSQFPKKYQL